MSTGFLQLQALLVVARIGCSFGGGGDECFGEGNWAYWLGMEKADRWVVKGRSGMCLAVQRGVGVDFSTAVGACAASFHDGKLLSNDSWDAFVKARDNSTILSQLDNQYVGFSPKPEKGCFLIDSSMNAKLDNPCQPRLRSFVCEYPRQKECRWELMTNENATKVGGGPWQLETVLAQLQEVDGSEVTCKPNYQNVTISELLAACKPLFNDTWSQWSSCGSCGNQRLPSQSRHQDLTYECNKIASGMQRNHTKTCFQMPCSTDATTKGGVAVISISCLLMFLVVLSIFSFY